MDRQLGFTIARDALFRRDFQDIREPGAVVSPHAQERAQELLKAAGVSVGGGTPGAAGITTATNLVGYSLEGQHHKAHPLHEAAEKAGFSHVASLPEGTGTAHHYSNGHGSSLKLVYPQGFKMAGKSGLQSGANGVDLERAGDKEKASVRSLEGHDNHAYRGWDTRREKARI
jgi:hypothetical protein